MADDLDVEAIRARHVPKPDGGFGTWCDGCEMDWPCEKILLIAALDEERAKVEALLLGDKALQSRIWLGEECARLKAERDDARRLADLTAEQAAANAQIIDEERALRRAAEAAVERVRAELAFFGHVAEDADAPAWKREGLRRWVDLIYAALDDDPAAAASHSTQPGEETK